MLLIKNGLVHTMETDRPILADLLIKNGKISVNGKTVELTSKEFEIIDLFITNPGKVYTREALLDIIWGYDYPADIRTLDVHIRKLRVKLNDKGELIQTVKNIGYKIGGGLNE